MSNKIFLAIFISLLALSTSAFAFNPNDPIGWEADNTFPSQVVTGTGPYAVTYHFTNQTRVGGEVPIRVQLIATPANDFTIGLNTCVGTLPANGKCQLTVNYSPNTAGTASLRLKSFFGAFAITVPKNGISVSATQATGPTPPSPPPSAPQNLLMWALPSTHIQYPVYVYKSGTQVNFIPSSAAQAFIGAYPTNSTPPAPGDDNGIYNLYYQSGGSWHGCNVSLLNGAIVASETTCLGVVINSPHAPTSNVYTLAMGSYAWPLTSAPSSPSIPSGYSSRSITFINNTTHNYIRVQGTCSGLAACSSGYDVSLANGGGSTSISVGSAAMISGAFYVTGYCDGGTCGTYPTGPWVATGGHSPSDNGGHPYATKVEPTFLVINGGTTPTGASNIDVSAVDGYNIGVKLYPTGTLGGNYCTYTVPPENSNILGAQLYSSTAVLAQVPNGTALQTLCQNSSQLPPSSTETQWSLSVINGSFAGCMSPCTYATKTYGASSQLANQFCCTGSYNTPATCDATSANTVAANTSTYVINVYDTFQNIYPFAYGDAGSDYACPADTSFVADFIPTS
jgi:hypothetical protein